MDSGECLDRREIHDGKIVRLSVDTVRLPNGHVVELELIRHCGAAAVVAVDQDGHVLLVRQYRYATSGSLLEVPAGKLDAGESPDICARRELEEETGFRAARMESLGWIYTTPGFTDEKIWLYLATDLTATQSRLEHDEVLTVERVPLDEAVRQATEGDLTDSKSICALVRGARRLAVRD